MGADSPAKDSTSPLALGLNHLHPFGEHRRPRRALSIPGREVTLPKAHRHESNFYEGAVGKRSVQASRDHAAYHQATNCECRPFWSRLRPGARVAHRAAIAFGAGSLAGSKVNAGKPTTHLQPKASCNRRHILIHAFANRRSKKTNKGQENEQINSFYIWYFIFKKNINWNFPFDFKIQI